MMALINDRQVNGLVNFIEIMGESKNDIILKETNIGKTIIEYNNDDEYVEEYVQMLVKVGEAS